MSQKVMIVGASGHLGGKIFQKLSKNEGLHVSALVREDSKIAHLDVPDDKLVIGDLTNPESLKKGMEGQNIVISTANAAVPRKKSDTFQSIDYLGNRNLIDAAKENGVKQFLFVSVANLEDKHYGSIPFARAKKQTENYLKESGITYTILRPSVFMDVFLSFMGTDIPTKNEAAHTVNRPWKFMNNFYNGVKDNIANGKIGIIGSGNVKQNYIAVEDIAEIVSAVLNREDMTNKTLDIGGPENLTANEVKTIFEEVLGKPLKIKRTPAFMMKTLASVFSLFNKEVANIFNLNYLSAKRPVLIDSSELARSLGVNQTKIRDFLTQKLNE